MATYDLNITEQAIVRETDKALCVSINGQERWLPRRMVSWREAGPCYLPTIEVPFWWARQNGLVSTARNPGH